MKDNIVELFFDQVKRTPYSIALIHGDRSLSYIELSRQVQATAAYYSRKGVIKGMRVLVFVPMSIRLYQTILALFSLGATVVFVDEWANQSRLEKALQVVDIDAIIAPRKFLFLTYIVRCFRKIPLKLSAPKKMTFKAHTYTTVQSNTTALITFTTGSTGLPKAANRTHQFLWEQFRILKSEIGANPNEKCVSTLPIVLLSILATGATGVIADYNQKKPHKINATRILDFLHQEKVELLIASPYFVQQLAISNSMNLPHLRKILTGGAPVFSHVASKIDAAFPNSKNTIAYGSTEAEPISTIDMSELVDQHAAMDHGLAVGVPHAEVEIKIIKITSGPIVLDGSGWDDWIVSDGQLGEIIVSGPHVLDAYYNSKDAFKMNKIYDSGVIWHRTGDSGRLINNMLYLSGRCSSLIEDKSGYISQFLVEDQLSQLDSVKIGTITRIGKKLHLFIELEKDANRNEAEREIKTLEINYDELNILSKIPRDPRHYSKIEYSKLT